MSGNLFGNSRFRKYPPYYIKPGMGSNPLPGTKVVTDNIKSSQLLKLWAFLLLSAP